MIVVDSNILAYLYLPGKFTEQAEKLMAEDSDWVAPPRYGEASFVTSWPDLRDEAR